MRRRRKPRAGGRAGVWALASGIVLLLLPTLGPPALAEGPPLLTVVRDGMAPGHHPLSMITTITFAEDTLLVSEGAGQVSAYPLHSVTRVWFDFSGAATSVVTEPEPAAAIVRTLHLLQSRPNPTSLATSIAFDLPAGGHATLVIYSVSGARVRTLVDEKTGPGRHTVSWDGRNDAGQPVAGGVYFYRLVTAGVDESRRLVYLR